MIFFLLPVAFWLVQLSTFPSFSIALVVKPIAAMTPSPQLLPSAVLTRAMQFDPAVALEHLYYTEMTNCDTELVMNWTCGWCKPPAHPLTEMHFLDSAKEETHGYVARVKSETKHTPTARSGYNLEHLPVIVNNLPLNLKPGENKANKLRAYWGMMSETLQESGIHGSCQIIEYAASRDDIVRKVIMAAEAFPWQAITSEPKPMNFDEQSQAAEEAMRQYEAQVEALNIELKANKAKMEQLEKEARGREEQQRLKYEQELEAMRARARRPFGDLMEMLVRLLSGKV